MYTCQIYETFILREGNSVVLFYKVTKFLKIKRYNNSRLYALVVMFW